MTKKTEVNNDLPKKEKIHVKDIAPIEPRKKCGIVMPIAQHEDYPAGHWSDVLNILVEATEETEFEASLVSEALDVGIIHERIVNNLYSNDIVICDVSSKNPNVMFELGLRLAFDKPTIIIKDEKTTYLFDTGVIEHLTYPSSLRFSEIVKFKNELIRRINATYKKSIEDPKYSPFLKSFGTKLIPTKINETEISENKYIINGLMDIRARLDQYFSQMYNQNKSHNYFENIDRPNYLINLRIDNIQIINEVVSNVLTDLAVNKIQTFNPIKKDIDRISIPVIISDNNLSIYLKNVEQIKGVSFVSYTYLN